MDCSTRSPREKRRSARRTSLHQTLEHMSTKAPDTASTETHLSKVEEPVAKKSKVDYPHESTLLDYYKDEETDKLIKAELQREVREWGELLDKYRRSKHSETQFQENLEPFTIPVKYQLQNQQIDELEAKFSTSISVINAFMERIHVMKANRLRHIENMTRSVYEKRLAKFESTDPRTVISRIFELHQQTQESTNHEN